MDEKPILLLWSLLIFSVCPVLSSTVSQKVFVSPGEDITLSLNQTDIVDVSWIADGNHFASTIPNKDVVIRDKRYKGRLKATADGSLIIINVTWEDQKVYRANFLSDKDLPHMEFDLRVLDKLSPEDIDIVHVVSSNETWACALSCKVNQSNVTITWSSSDGRGLHLINGSLHVPDNATNISYTCTARNPLGRADKRVLPRELCKGEPNPSPRVHVSVPIIMVASIALVVVVWCIVYRRVCRKEARGRGPQTTYTEVQSPSNAYGQTSETGREAAVNTLYSEVQHVRRPETNEQNSGQENINCTGKTIYSIVQHTKDSKHRKEEAKESMSSV